MDERDQQLNCVDCGEAFTFNIGEQRFFAARGFDAPKRCPKCRHIRGVKKRVQDERATVAPHLAGLEIR